MQAGQALVVAATVAVFYLLARRIFDLKLSLVVTALLGLYIPFTIWAALIMSEALFIFLLILSIYLAICSFQTQRGKYYVAFGIVLALASLTRPVTVLLPFVLIAILVVVSWDRIPLRRRILLNLLFATSFFLVILPWGMRNAVSVGDYTVLPNSGGVNLWFGTHPDWKQFVKYGTGYAWELDELHDISDYNYYISPEADELFFDAGIDSIKNDPTGWMSRNVQKLGLISYYSFLLEMRPSVDGRGLINQYPGMLSIAHAATLEFIFLTLCGLFQILVGGITLLVLGVIVYFWAVQGISSAGPRNMLPIIPLYILFTAPAFSAVGTAASNGFA